LQTLYTFCPQLINGQCPDGTAPLATLVQANDGNLYGTTGNGGADDCYLNNGCGTIFGITTTGMFSTLHTFDRTDGARAPGLVQATDGNLYGTTIGGGTSINCADFYPDGCGTILRLSLGLLPFVELKPTTGAVGTPVTILGTNLTGATEVTFAGTSATILSNTGSAITTTVPSGATTGTVQVTLPGGTLNSNTDFQVTGPLQLVPVTPCRLVDTRNGNPIRGGTSENFTLPQLGSCDIPASAAAYSLNVTVAPHGPLGYLTIWPEGEIQPYVSTMNSPDGRVKANAAIVPASNNAVSVYVTDTSDVILDIDGYFTAPGAQTLQFYPLAPCRVVDTRAGSQQPQGLGPPYLHDREIRELPILSTTCPGLPAQPAAYSFNVTAVPYPAGHPENYITLWPSDQPQPNVSTLNNYTGTVVANAAIVPAASDGSIKVFAYDSTNLLIDINGYFAAPGGGGLSFYPTAPCRAYDSRHNQGQPFQGTRVVDIVDSACAPPSNAQAYVFNATVVPTNGPMGYLTLWPDGQTRPNASTLNAYDGFVTSNMAIVPNGNGSIDAYADGLTHLILDISGYFAP